MIPFPPNSPHFAPMSTGRRKSLGGGDRVYYRCRGLQYIGGSVADSTRRAYESGRRSWDKFCRLMHYEKCLKPSDSEEHKVWVLIKYASWCCEAEGNLAGTISRKLAAVQYFNRLEAGVNSLPQHQRLRARSNSSPLGVPG